MTTGTATTLLEQFHNLPALPRALQQLLSEFRRPEAQIDRVARLVRADPVLSMRLLRLANSAFYQRGSTVSRIEDAVIFLGLQVVQNLVLATSMTRTVRYPEGFPQKSFLRFCLHSAAAARHIAAAVRADRETAFTLGLIRAIGVPLMYGALPGAMSLLDRSGSRYFDPDRCALEQAQLGFDHVQLATALMQRWHFPEPLVATLNDCGMPSADKSNFTLAMSVKLGAWIAGSYEEGVDLKSAQPTDLLQQLRRINLDDADLAAMPTLKELSQGLEQLLE